MRLTSNLIVIIDTVRTVHIYMYMYSLVMLFGFITPIGLNLSV